MQLDGDSRRWDPAPTGSLWEFTCQPRDNADGLCKVVNFIWEFIES